MRTLREEVHKINERFSWEIYGCIDARTARWLFGDVLSECMCESSYDWFAVESGKTHRSLPRLVRFEVVDGNVTINFAAKVLTHIRETNISIFLAILYTLNDENCRSEVDSEKASVCLVFADIYVIDFLSFIVKWP